MRKQFSKFAKVAALGLALTFTFSCSSNDDNGGNTEQKCGGISYDPSAYRCETGELVGKCKGEDYYPAYQQCVGGVIVEGVSSSSVTGNGGSSSSVTGGKSSSGGGGSCNINISDYGTVKIGNQTWMAKNLNCDVEGSKCYDDDPANCKKYGRLYDWATAMVVCPSGWHLPSNEDWETLIAAVGGIETASENLKSKNDWKKPDGVPDVGGNDKFGFSALPGGYYFASFNDGGSKGNWWSSSELDSWNAYRLNIRYDTRSGDNIGLGAGSKSYLFSVRCLQD